VLQRRKSDGSTQLDIAGQGSVRRWLASRKVPGRTGEDARHVDMLRRFSEKVAKSPDEMIDECLRR
jgi:hypothetical protein